eukprot:1114757-Pelagomonas_calceolata.AAC.7
MGLLLGGGGGCAAYRRARRMPGRVANNLRSFGYFFISISDGETWGKHIHKVAAGLFTGAHVHAKPA